MNLLNYLKIVRQRRYLDLKFAVEARSPQLLAAELRRAAKEHHLFEERVGQEDEDWSDWYSQFLLGRIGVPSDVQRVPSKEEILDAG